MLSRFVCSTPISDPYGSNISYPASRVIVHGLPAADTTGVLTPTPTALTGLVLAPLNVHLSLLP